MLPAVAVLSTDTSTDVVLPEAVEKPARSRPRLAWLDALRGIAALAVVYTHFGFAALPELYQRTNVWITAGTFGVALFFLISGYIVPASLERRGSIRTFWVSRVFRLYPLWFFAIACVLVFVYIGIRNGGPPLANKKAMLAGHLTMLQEFIGVPGVLNVMWTLSFEMAFYFICVALFTLKLHRRSAEMSIGFTLASVIGAGGLIPAGILVSGVGWRGLLVAVLVIGAVGIALSVSGRRPLAIAGVCLLGLTALGLLVLNPHAPQWWSLLLPAVLFGGNAIYRADTGERSRWVGILTIGVLVVGSVLTIILHGMPEGVSFSDGLLANRKNFFAIFAAVALFGIGMLLRHRRVPRILAWLGVVSYSVYLLHPLIQQLNFWKVNSSLSVRVVMVCFWVGLLLSVCSLAYRWIEKPCQDLGKRVAKALDNRFGPDTHVPLGRDHNGAR